MNPIEKRRQRAALYEQMTELDKKARDEKRSLSAEEQAQWDKINADVDALKVEIEAEERGAQLQAQQMADRPTPPAATDQKSEYRKAFWAYIRDGIEGLTPDARAVLRAGFRALEPEQRAMTAGIATAGGYTIADEDMAGLVQAMLPWGGMFQSGMTVLTTTTGADLPIPTSNDSSNKGERVGEGVAHNEQDVTVGQKILRAYLYSSKMIKVSYQLLQDSSFDLESWLRERLAERIGRIVNEEFTTGTGAAQPEGVVTGAVTAATTASATDITYAEMVTLEHSINAAYRKSARFMMADATLKVLKQKVDGLARPLWRAGLAEGEPDTLLGYPYVVNDDVAAIAANAKALLFGDFRNYWSRNVRGTQVLRLTERYAEYGLVAFLAFSRHDGCLVDAGTHPVKYLTQHA